VESHYVPAYPKHFNVKLASIFRVWLEASKAAETASVLGGCKLSAVG
jgi:hypothetical protein